MKKIELILMAEGNYFKWRDECRKQISPHLPMSDSFRFNFSVDTKLKDAEHEMLQKMIPLLSGNQTVSHKSGRKYEFIYPSFSSGLDKKRTLGDLGFLSGEIVVIGYNNNLRQLLQLVFLLLFVLLCVVVVSLLSKSK